MSYEWRKDDLIVGGDSSANKKIRIVTAPDNFQSTLRVIDLKPSDAGVYSCLAKNKHGQDRVYTQLNVKGKWSLTLGIVDDEQALFNRRDWPQFNSNGSSSRETSRYRPASLCMSPVRPTDRRNPRSSGVKWTVQSCLDLSCASYQPDRRMVVITSAEQGMGLKRIWWPV